MKILVANIGSTSFKFRLFDVSTGATLAEGRSERIGQGGDCPDYVTAIGQCIQGLVGEDKPLLTLSDLAAVGFKAVLARNLSGARLVSDEVIQAMEEFAFLAPAHNPPYVDAMRAFRKSAPGVPLVALFETAFFDDLPEKITTYAIPYEWREKESIRRHGFHGASHRHASERVGALCPGKGLRHISCHLGGSSSLAAIRDGLAVNTSFGMSPQSGLPQSSRSGDLDVFAVLYLMKKCGWDPDAVARRLSRESGLAGISGCGGDIRDLLEAAAAGNHRAALALDVYVESIRHYLGAFLLQLGGLDVLTFSGGVGERGAAVREAVCRGLAPFGICLDEKKNRAAQGEVRISEEGFSVEIWVIPANEEWMVARAAAHEIAAMQAESERSLDGVLR